MRALLAFVLLLSAPLAYAQAVFRADIANNQEVRLEGTTHVLFSHATAYWDYDSSSRAGVRALLAFANRHRYPTLAAVHEAAINNPSDAELYFVRPGETTRVLNSEAGQHRLSFPQARHVFIAGGNLTLCLCEAIRDVVRGTRQTAGTLNLVLVRDAIYDWDGNLDPIGREDVDSFVHSYFMPSFRCPGQNWYGFPQQRLSDTKLHVTFDSQPVADYDLEPGDAIPTERLRRSINAHFILSSGLARYRSTMSR